MLGSKKGRDVPTTWLSDIASSNCENDVGYPCWVSNARSRVAGVTAGISGRVVFSGCWAGMLISFRKNSDSPLLKIDSVLHLTTIFLSNDKNDSFYMMGLVDAVLPSQKQAIIKLYPTRGNWPFGINRDSQSIFVNTL